MRKAIYGAGSARMRFLFCLFTRASTVFSLLIADRFVRIEVDLRVSTHLILNT